MTFADLLCIRLGMKTKLYLWQIACRSLNNEAVTSNRTLVVFQIALLSNCQWFEPVDHACHMGYVQGYHEDTTNQDQDGKADNTNQDQDDAAGQSTSGTATVGIGVARSTNEVVVVYPPIEVDQKRAGIKMFVESLYGSVVTCCPMGMAGHILAAQAVEVETVKEEVDHVVGAEANEKAVPPGLYSLVLIYYKASQKALDTLRALLDISDVLGTCYLCASLQGSNFHNSGNDSGLTRELVEAIRQGKEASNALKAHRDLLERDGAIRLQQELELQASEALDRAKSKSQTGKSPKTSRLRK